MERAGSTDDAAAVALALAVGPVKGYPRLDEQDADHRELRRLAEAVEVAAPTSVEPGLAGLAQRLTLASKFSKASRLKLAVQRGTANDGETLPLVTAREADASVLGGVEALGEVAAFADRFELETRKVDRACCEQTSQVEERLEKAVEHCKIEAHKSVELMREEIGPEFQELFRLAHYLTNFAIKNYGELAAILSMHQLRHRRFREGFLSNVLRAQVLEKADFAQAKDIRALIQRINVACAVELFGGNTQLAQFYLLQKRRESIDWDTAFVGGWVGAAVVATVWASYAIQIEESEQTVKFQNTNGQRIYRGLGAVLLMCWGLCVQIAMWREARVNFPVIFALPAASFPPTSRLFRFMAILTMIYLANLITFVKSLRNAGSHAGLLPLMLLASWTLLLVVAWWRSMLSPRLHSKGILAAVWGSLNDTIQFLLGLSARSFLSAYISDYLTSSGKILTDFAVVTCDLIVVGPRQFYNLLTSDRIHDRPPDSILHRVAIPVIVCWPLWLRLSQNLTRFYLTGRRFPFLVNALKYAMAHTIVIFSALVPELMDFSEASKAPHIWRVVFVTCFVVTTFATFCWDVAMDWGLGRPQHALLRKRLMLETIFQSRKPYYVAIAADFCLRYTWALTVVPSVNETFVLSTGALTALEVTRRSFWGVLRVENEHLNNTRSYRSTEYIPLYFDTFSSSGGESNGGAAGPSRYNCAEVTEISDEAERIQEALREVEECVDKEIQEKREQGVKVSLSTRNYGLVDVEAARGKLQHQLGDFRSREREETPSFPVAERFNFDQIPLALIGDAKYRALEKLGSKLVRTAQGPIGAMRRMPVATVHLTLCEDSQARQTMGKSKEAASARRTIRGQWQGARGRQGASGGGSGEDKGQAGISCLAACCPAMDLVALANDSQLVVQRSIKWERLFGSMCSVSCLTWRPDGKALAVGQEDGLIALYDVEHGEAFSLPKSSRPHKDPITCMTWTKKVADPKHGASSDPNGDEEDLWDVEFKNVEGDAYIDRANLLAEVHHGGSNPHERGTDSFKSYASALMDMPLFGVDNTPRRQLEVLASGDTAGVVTLGAFGYFPVGCIDLSGAFQQDQVDGLPAVSHLCLSDDLRMLLAILECEGRFRMVSVDTKILADRSDELRHVAAQCGHIGEEMVHVQAAIQEMSKQWTEATSVLHRHLEPLQRQLKNFDRPNTPEQELFMMLTCGVTSAALQRYIADLQEHTLQRLGKSLDTACASLEEIASKTMYRAAQALVFRLHDLHGLAEWTQRFQGIGLEVQPISDLLHDAQLLMLKVQETLTWVRDAHANFAALSVWLQTVWRKNQKQNSAEAVERTAAGRSKHYAHIDIDRLVRVLSRQLLHPHISEQFQSGPLSSHDQPALWTSATRNTNSTVSLLQAFERLQAGWNKAFHMISLTVSAVFRPVENLRLPDLDRRQVDVRFARNRFIVALAKAPDTVELITCAGAGSDRQEIRLSDVKELQDLRFYNNDTLALTLRDSSGVRVLAQLPFQDPSASLGRRRTLSPASIDTADLVCDGSRGVAAVFTSNRRLQLFDMEEDEEEVEDEEEEEAEDEE
ncbi:SPX and EXS domain-containing protein 1 [Durusdinium trenchii]|uniref:Anaphase-promoting complex subunit 4 n=1 Tax=Durusdinium trenchii TaxID=1381693 RepID=A0ABP0RHD8_9DINO